MVPLARRMLRQERGRFVITVGGIAFMIVLILFLLGIYYGVARGATGFVEASRADVWVAVENATNLLRSSSFMRASALDDVRVLDGVEEVAGVLRLITTAEVEGRPVTLFIFGIDPASSLARPEIVAGSERLEAGDVLLDRSFAAKHRLAPGDTIEVQGRPFQVRGLSKGTNALVAQFSFVSLEDAQQLLGLPGVVSFGVVRLRNGSEPGAVAARINARVPRLVGFSKAAFVQNNLEEMETGVLPVLWTIALFGACAGTAVLALLLYGAVRERREDYAVLRALGAPHPYLRRVVLRQALLSGLLGFGAGLVLYALCTPVLRRLVPELEMQTTPGAVGATLLAALGLSLVASWAALRQLRGVYPVDVFRS